MKVVKPGTPLPAGIREKLESMPPSGRGPDSIRPGSLPPQRPGTKSGPVRPGTKSGPLGTGSISPDRVIPGTRSGPLTLPPHGHGKTSVRPSAPPAVRSAALDEVERALSVLGGRHPDAERVEREVRAEREWRQAQVAEEAKRSRRMRRIRRVVQVAVGIGLTITGVAGFVAYRTRDAAESAITTRAQMYINAGFAAWIAPKWPNGSQLEGQVDVPSCLVAVGTSDLDGALEVTRGSDVRASRSSAAFCACPGDHVKVRSTDPNATMVRLLRVEPRAVGGPVGLAFLQPKPGVVFPATGGSCAPGALESWMNEGHGATSTNVSLDKSPGRKTLAAVGFEVIGSAARIEPLLLLRGGAERCVLVASTAEEDPLTLRLGGVEPAQAQATGRIAWCGTRAQIATVEHGLAGDLVAYEVSAAQIGGSLGLAEWEARARMAPIFTAKTSATKVTDWPFVAPTDLAWDALLALRASGAPEAKVTAGADMVQWVADARLSSLAVLSHGEIQASDGAPMYGCTPVWPGPRSVCSEAGPTTWQLRGEPGTTAVAQSAMPFWLSALNADDEPGAQEAASNALAFARRMHALGFAPTSLDHVVELDAGVEVSGRTGEDEIVALGIGTLRPFLVPYTDATPWRLDGEPRVVPLPEGRRVRLSAASALDIPVAKRRTVVFRHVIGSAATSPQK